MRFFFIIIFLFYYSCSFKKNPLKNQKSTGHSELYSEPEKPTNKISDNEIKIVIATTSELNGSGEALQFKFRDSHHQSEQAVSIGGKETIKKYQQILRDTFSNVIFVEPGNILNVQDDSSTQDLYSELNYDAITFGISDFRISLPSTKTGTIENLKDFAEKSNSNVIVTNLIDLKTSKKVEWKGVKNQIIKEFNGVKVGILGILPDELTTVTPPSNRVGLFVEDMLEASMAGARALRLNGADLVVVLTNQTINCGEELAQERTLPLKKVNFEPRKNNVCDLSSPLGQYLMRLPPNLIDVVITGNNNEKVANYVNNILVMGAHNKGLSMSYSEFIYKKDSKAFDLDSTIVHQPIFLCQDFFKDTNDCYHEDATVNHVERVPAKFLGQPIIPEEKSDKITNQSKFEIDYNFFLKNFNADFILKPKNINSSQFVILDFRGDELIRFLESDYNEGCHSDWFGITFKEIDHTLYITAKNESLKQDRSYRVLTDLETLSNKSILSSKISSLNNSEMNHLSWKTYSLTDSIKIRLSSANR